MDDNNHPTQYLLEYQLSEGTQVNLILGAFLSEQTKNDMVTFYLDDLKSTETNHVPTHLSSRVIVYN